MGGRPAGLAPTRGGGLEVRARSAVEALRVASSRFLGLGYGVGWVQGLGLEVWGWPGLGSRVGRVQGLGLEVWGCGLAGLRVQGWQG